MKHTISYHNQTGQEKRDKGIADMRNYLSAYSMDIVETVAMSADLYSQLSFVASFAGVQGYPVAALWEETRQIMRDMTN